MKNENKNKVRERRGGVSNVLYIYIHTSICQCDLALNLSFYRTSVSQRFEPEPFAYYMNPRTCFYILSGRPYLIPEEFLAGSVPTLIIEGGGKKYNTIRF